jgi:hypothetical protein
MVSTHLSVSCKRYENNKQGFSKSRAYQDKKLMTTVAVPALGTWSQPTCRFPASTLEAKQQV